MENTKKSYQAIFSFLNGARIYVGKNTEETKLKYAITRTSEGLDKAVKEYNQKVKDIKLEHAYADEKGRVPFVVNQDGSREYEYTKDGLKNCDKAIEDLFQSEVEISVHYATELPKEFDEKMFGEVFKGFVIKEEKSKEKSSKEETK